ncbi:hypothetical protein BASA81_006890 [Batrachochytrium salamandrivorans]|nr:hypothetical protein BASA81_006890 [Batrachochytrium salamandrivorans]
MQVHDLFVFERSGKLLFRHRVAGGAEQDERDKLVYGLLFSFKQLIPLLARKDQISEEGIRSFSTSAYTLHSFETATGYRFVLITSLCTQQQQQEVRRLLEVRIFQSLFVDLVMLDPSYQPKAPIDSPEFAKQVAHTLDRLQ